MDSEICSSSSAGVVAGCAIISIAVIVLGVAVVLVCVKHHRTGDKYMSQTIVEHHFNLMGTYITGIQGIYAFASGAQHSCVLYRAPCGSTNADKSSLCHCSEIIWQDQDTALPCI